MAAWQSTPFAAQQSVNDTLSGSTNRLELSTKKYDLTYLSDDNSLDHIAEFIVGQYIDYIYVPICAALGILGNILAFCVLVSVRSKGSTVYVYMASLAVSDTFVQIVNILFLVRKFPGHEVLKEGTCGFVFLLLYFSFQYNMVVMVTMTVERYLAIRFPLKATQWFTPMRARFVVLIEALVVFGLNVQHLILRGMVYDKESGHYFCVPKGEFTKFYMFKIWPWIDGFIYCYIPFVCLVVFNLLILRQVRSSRAFQSKSDTLTTVTSADKSSRMSEKEVQLTIMLLLLTTTFLIFVTPMAVIIVVERYHWFPKTPLEKAQYYLVRVIVNNLVYTNHALNFPLYCLSGKRFRKELMQTFGCFFSGSGGESSRARSGPDDSYVSCEKSVSTRNPMDNIM